MRMSSMYRNEPRDRSHSRRTGGPRTATAPMVSPPPLTSTYLRHRCSPNPLTATRSPPSKGPLSLFSRPHLGCKLGCFSWRCSSERGQSFLFFARGEEAREKEGCGGGTSRLGGMLVRRAAWDRRRPHITSPSLRSRWADALGYLA